MVPHVLPEYLTGYSISGFPVSSVASRMNGWRVNEVLYEGFFKWTSGLKESQGVEAHPGGSSGHIILSLIHMSNSQIIYTILWFPYMSHSGFRICHTFCLLSLYVILWRFGLPFLCHTLAFLSAFFMSYSRVFICLFYVILWRFYLPFFIRHTLACLSAFFMSYSGVLVFVCLFYVILWRFGLPFLYAILYIHVIQYSMHF